MKKKWYWIVGSATIILLSFIFLYYECYWTGLFCPSPITVAIERARQNSCQTLKIVNCSSNTSSISVEGFDANRDGKIDSSDTLFELCKKYYGCIDEACCKRVCGCP